MDLRHEQLPWSEQIWAKIHADLAQALANSRKVRSPFEVFHVPPSTQTVMADRRVPFRGYGNSETETAPVLELSSNFSLRPSQVFNEGENFFSIDRIISAAYQIGFAEDRLLLSPYDPLPRDVTVSQVPQPYWDGLFLKPRAQGAPPDPYFDRFVRWPYKSRAAARKSSIGPVGLELFNAVNKAREFLRAAGRYDPYALILSSKLEGEVSSTVPGTNSLNTPIERLRPLAPAGVFGTPALPGYSAVLVSVARAWVDIAQAMEPSVQFLTIDGNGDYRMRLVERFTFRLKDRSARCMITMYPV